MEALDRIFNSLKDLTENLGDVKETVARIEEQNIACFNERKEHENKIVKLEAKSNQIEGMFSALKVLGFIYSAILILIAIYTFLIK